MGIMLLYEEFENVTIEYEQKIFEIFKRTIDAAIVEATKQNMNALDKYVYIRDRVEVGFRELASVQGYNHEYPYISDTLIERIYSYYEHITNEARIFLQAKVDEMMECDNLGELLNKLEEFNKLIKEKSLEDYMYNDLELKKRVM